MRENEPGILLIAEPPQPIAALPEAADSQPNMIAAAEQFFRPVNTESRFSDLPDDLSQSPVGPSPGVRAGDSNSTTTDRASGNIDTFAGANDDAGELVVDLLAELLFPFDDVDCNPGPDGLESLDWFDEIEADPAVELERSPVAIPVAWAGSVTAIPIAAPDS